MSYRAAIILLNHEDRIALIERHRQGLHYFTFPGGHVDAGETPEQAAVRETMEELGLQVVIKKLVARMKWQGNWQHYFLVEARGGNFGEGQGPEMYRSVQESGTYHPIWLPVCELLEHPVKPRELAELVCRWVTEGWPETPVILDEG